MINVISTANITEKHGLSGKLTYLACSCTWPDGILWGRVSNFPWALWAPKTEVVKNSHHYTLPVMPRLLCLPQDLFPCPLFSHVLHCPPYRWSLNKSILVAQCITYLTHDILENTARQRGPWFIRCFARPSVRCCIPTVVLEKQKKSFHPQSCFGLRSLQRKAG